MDFGSPYRQVGTIDITALGAAVEALSEDDWSRETGRQAFYRAHARTQTIPLIFDPDMRHAGATTHAMFHHFQPVLAPALETIAGYYAENVPPGVQPDVTPYFARTILVRLPGGANIGSHRDHGASLSRAHRIHLPVITNPQTVFGISGVIKHLPAGELWEINNRMAHAVRNDSDLARVHFIFDYVLPGEIVSDPEGQLVA